MGKEAEKTSQVFEPDILNRHDVIIYFKDLIEVGPILDFDWEKEMGLFMKRLGGAGWGEEQISDMLQIACSQSRYMKEVSPSIRKKGNWMEWLELKARTK